MTTTEPAWVAELRRMDDEKLRVELSVKMDAAFWEATLALKAGEPSVKAMRYAVDVMISSLIDALEGE